MIGRHLLQEVKWVIRRHEHTEREALSNISLLGQTASLDFIHCWAVKYTVQHQKQISESIWKAFNFKVTHLLPI